MRKKTHDRRVRHIEKTAEGTYTYTGEFLRLVAPTARAQALPRMAVLAGAAAMACVLPGLMPVAGLTRTLNVTLSYAAQVVAVVTVVWALVRLARAGEKIRSYVREETADQLPSRALMSAFFAAVTAAGDLVRLIGEGVAPDGFELAFLACELLCAVACALLWRYARSLCWEPVR